jgi:hypothetical protein
MRVISIVLDRVLRRQARILRYQNQIMERLEDMSEVIDQVKDFAAKIDAATNAIAIRIQTLIDKINAGTATPEEIAAVLQPEVDRLTELGKDPTNPVQSEGEGGPNLWTLTPGTGRAVVRARCQNGPRGGIWLRSLSAPQILMAIQAIGIPGDTNTVHPANYFASSV